MIKHIICIVLAVAGAALMALPVLYGLITYITDLIRDLRGK